MEHPYGEQYGQEGNPRAYMTMRDYRDLPYQWQQPIERNPNPPRSMRDYRNLAWQNQQPLGRNPNPNRSMREYRDQWMSAPVYSVPSTYPPPPQYDHPEPPFYASTPQSPLSQQPPPLSPVEKAILNLSKVVGIFVEEQKVLKVQTNQRFEAVESSVNRNLRNVHAKISKLSNQLLQSSEKEKGLFQGQKYQNMANKIGLTEDPNTRTGEEKAVVTLRSGRELQTAVPELVKSAPVGAEPLQEEQTSALISEEESQEEECLSDTMVEEQCQQHLLLEPSDIGATVSPWANHTALLTEEGNGKEEGEKPQKLIFYLNPIDLDPNAIAQPKKNPLPVTPSDDQVYILPTPATKSKPAAPAPKGKSNPSLHAMQNFRKLVAIAHALATTSKTMATAYIAWHSGWFGCGFGFGTPGPRHF